MKDVRFDLAYALKEEIQLRPLEKVTVSSICRRAHITRQTFYRHFLDKDDLVCWYFGKLCLKSFEEMGDSGTLDEALHKKFTFIKKELAFFKEAFKGKDYNSLVAYDYRSIYIFFSDLVKKKTTINDELDFLLQIYCHGAIEMTVQWVKKDADMAIDVLVHHLILAIPYNLQPYLL